MGRTHYNGIPGVKRCAYDGERMRCARVDFESIALAGRLMHACRGALGARLERRLRLVPGAWQRWRAGTALLAQAMDAIYATVPDDQFERMCVLVERGELSIELPKAVAGGDGVTIVHHDALEALARAAMRAECAICLKADGHVRSCALRKALDGVMDPVQTETSGCVWRDQALRAR